MKYISTRGAAPKLNFEEVLMTGLASDGGLYIPENIPEFKPHEIAAMAEMDYNQLALTIFRPFIGGLVSDKELKKIIDEAYEGFRHSAIAPLKQISTNEFLLELFHGPTLAFKDFAMQVLAGLLDHFLKKRKKKVVILGATSGDTGSAAIEACKRCGNVDIFILHPKGRTSDIQRKQMTTVMARNVFNVALEGNFDDCQNIVKELFGQREFLGKRELVAVNSINWVRIMAQIVYYFYAALRLGSPAKAVSFSVPTGNFGDIFAGFIALKMGLPIAQLIIATNRNDILSRFINKNNYEQKGVVPSLSPSMDIQISSNFERLLYYINDESSEVLAGLMKEFKTKGSIKVEESALSKARSIFSGYAVDDKTTIEVIKNIYKETGELLDPHTATGVRAGRECNKNTAVPMVVLATAHPAKFPESYEKAGLDAAELPEHMKHIFTKEEKFTVLKNSAETVKKFILENV